MSESQQIETALVKIGIKARKTRNKIASRILIIIGLVLFFFLFPYFERAYVYLLVVDVFLIVAGGWYLFLYALPKLVQPLEPEYYAVKNIADAIHLLEKLKEDIAYEEAYPRIETAYSALKELRLTDGIVWYKATNEIFRKFLKDLELIVLPTIKDSSIDSVMKVKHLKQIALAIYSFDPNRLDRISKMLEDEPSYKKSTVKVEGIRTQVNRFFQSYSFLKHGLVIVCFL